MNPHPHYNLLKYFLHQVLPPSSSAADLLCPDSFEAGFPGAAPLHNATALSHLPPLHRAGCVPLSSALLASCTEDVTQLSKHRPSV